MPERRLGDCLTETGIESKIWTRRRRIGISLHHGQRQSQRDENAERSADSLVHEFLARRGVSGGKSCPRSQLIVLVTTLRHRGTADNLVAESRSDVRHSIMSYGNGPSGHQFPDNRDPTRLAGRI